MKKNISWSFMALFLIINLLSSCATPASKFNYASRINTISSYEEFIRRYPDSPYVSEARKKIQKLKEEAAFKEAESKNSIAAYRHFIEMYPDSELVEKAKNRIAASEEEALIRTWRLGTVEAFQGFIESYPDGSYILEAKRRLEYLKAVAEGTIDVYLDFVREYPNSPFVKEAKSAFPILPLFDKKVGVVINVRKTCKKRSPKDVKNKIWEDLKLLFENLNIQAVDATDNQMSNVEILLVINYQESKSLDPAFSFLYVKDQFDLVRYQAWVMSHKQPSNLAVSAGDALGALLAEAIIGLFDPFLYERGSITIKDARTGEIYYYKNILAGERASTKFSYFRRLLRHSLLSKRSHNLFSKDLKERLNTVMLWKAVGGKTAIPPLLVALEDEDPCVRQIAKEGLESPEYKQTSEALPVDVEINTKAFMCKNRKKENPTTVFSSSDEIDLYLRWPELEEGDYIVKIYWINPSDELEQCTSSEFTIKERAAFDCCLSMPPYEKLHGNWQVYVFLNETYIMKKCFVIR